MRRFQFQCFGSSGAGFASPISRRAGSPPTETPQTSAPSRIAKRTRSGVCGRFLSMRSRCRRRLGNRWAIERSGRARGPAYQALPPARGRSGRGRVRDLRRGPFAARAVRAGARGRPSDQDELPRAAWRMPSHPCRRSWRNNPRRRPERRVGSGPHVGAQRPLGEPPDVGGLGDRRRASRCPTATSGWAADLVGRWSRCDRPALRSGSSESQACSPPPGMRGRHAQHHGLLSCAPSFHKDRRWAAMPSKSLGSWMIATKPLNPAGPKTMTRRGRSRAGRRCGPNGGRRLGDQALRRRRNLARPHFAPTRDVVREGSLASAIETRDRRGRIRRRGRGQPARRATFGRVSMSKPPFADHALHQQQAQPHPRPAGLLEERVGARHLTSSSRPVVAHPKPASRVGRPP